MKIYVYLIMLITFNQVFVSKYGTKYYQEDALMFSLSGHQFFKLIIH